MMRQLASTTFVLTALAAIEISTAQAKQQCSAAMPSDPQCRWWAYRLIDGRKCWYEGKPGLSKSLLEWPKEPSAPPASEDIASNVREKARTVLDSQAWAPNSQALAPIDADTFEARWHALPETAVSALDVRLATPELDDRPPLKKSDRLQSPYLDRTQAKLTRTIAIVPDPARPTVKFK